MTDTDTADLPSSFVVSWASRIFDALPAPRRALDVAMGRGRHALTLAGAGYRVFGVDIRHDAIRDAMVAGVRRNAAVRGWCADLTDRVLPTARFELVVVARYLQRDLFPLLEAALAPGGIILYETFTEAQRQLGRGPKSADHLLKPGELRGAFPRCTVVFYEEVSTPDCLARAVVRRDVRSA